MQPVKSSGEETPELVAFRLSPRASEDKAPDDKLLRYTRWYQLFLETDRDIPT